jgi:ribonucleoside-diphosphate reductase alpha chain
MTEVATDTYFNSGSDSKDYSPINEFNFNEFNFQQFLFQVVKRNGMLVPFDFKRIANAIMAAFTAEGVNTAKVKDITQQVVEVITSKALSQGSISVEEIQDVVELTIMQQGFFEIARRYIRYREEHKALREGSPRSMRVERRDGKGSVRFNPIKIATAIELAFRASLEIEGNPSEEVIRRVNDLTEKVIVQCQEQTLTGKLLDIEWIQDAIERQMMQDGYFKVAKDFILYRAKRAELRARRKEEESTSQESDRLHTVQLKISDTAKSNDGTVFNIINAKGEATTVTEGDLRRHINKACVGLNEVNSEEVLQESLKNFYDGIREEEIDTSHIMAARAKIESEPQYTYVAGRLLLNQLYAEIAGFRGYDDNFEKVYKATFISYIDLGIEHQLLSPELRTFDLKLLADNLVPARDQTFQYLGIRTLYDRYLIHKNEVRIELPQAFWMRVAMGLSLLEGESKNQRAIEFYEMLSTFRFVSSTPTLFNSGTLHSQMSSCYLTTIMDDLSHIFKCISDDAQLSKWAGGLGNDWTNVRATGASIRGTNGRSQGIIPFLKVANDTAVAVNQGGKRKGAMCAYLETWHLDIEDFLELRKNTGDERRRTHDMNSANWIPDLFMKRVRENGNWTLFNPSDVPDLHDLYGKAFNEKYAYYEQQVAEGKITIYKKIEAVSLWKKMLSMLFETGHPWITFKDPSNIRSPQSHCGVVHSSNLCTEILLNTSKDETAVCNLGSINLVAHVTNNGIDYSKLETTINTAIRMLDNVIDINFYPTPEAKNANLRHRPIGLGVMGFQDALYELGISYCSDEAVVFADKSMEAISYYSILASSTLAKERGAYESYKGSKWDQGMLPIDSIELLVAERGGEFVDIDRSSHLDWSKARDSIKSYGMRNSNTLAIAPTATISNIAGVTQSIEPSYKHLFTKSNLSGEFMVHNTYLVQDLKKIGLWDEEMIDDLKYFDGSIIEIERIPEDLKRLYPTAFEIEPEWLIECASRRQKWIDMGQSLNLYMSQPSGKKLHEMYMLAWTKGLKTTYYLRSLGATQIEKSTTDINKRGLQPRWMKSKSSSSDVVVARLESTKQPVVCSIDGDCESCQ